MALSESLHNPDEPCDAKDADYSDGSDDPDKYIPSLKDIQEIQDAQDAYKKQQSKWQASPTRNTFIDFFNKDGLHLKGKIDNISFVEILREILKVEHKNVYFQDTEFCDIDQEFLKLEGYTVKQCTEGYNSIKMTTLVFNAGWFQEMMHTLEIGCPAVYIGERLIPTEKTLEATIAAAQDNSELPPFDSEAPKPRWATDTIFLMSEKATYTEMPGIHQSLPNPLHMYYLAAEYLVGVEGLVELGLGIQLILPQQWRDRSFWWSG
ncbi:hypothetical protein MMC14_004397 [Varicellaria rhodocarpa]|nr:hypothetical protein [Varicellaria rhodocarpa]